MWLTVFVEGNNRDFVYLICNLRTIGRMCILVLVNLMFVICFLQSLYQLGLSSEVLTFRDKIQKIDFDISNKSSTF